MIDLKRQYGEKILDQSFFMKHLAKMRFAEGLFLNALFAWLLVEVFKIKWDYAVIKVFLLFELYALLRYFLSIIVETFNYRYIIKDWLAYEMKHYINIFAPNYPQLDNSGTYDDFLIASAYNPYLEDDLKVLAAMNYVRFVTTVNAVPLLEGRCYNLFGRLQCQYLKSLGRYDGEIPK